MSLTGHGGAKCNAFIGLSPLVVHHCASFPVSELEQQVPTLTIVVDRVGGMVPTYLPYSTRYLPYLYFLYSAVPSTRPKKTVFRIESGRIIVE